MPEKDSKFSEIIHEIDISLENLNVIARNKEDLPGIRPFHSIGLLKRNIHKKHCDELENHLEKKTENYRENSEICKKSEKDEIFKNCKNIENFNEKAEKSNFAIKGSDYSRFFWKKPDFSEISCINERKTQRKTEHNPLEEDISRILKEESFSEKIPRNSFAENEEKTSFSHGNKKIYDRMFEEIVDSKTRISFDF